jgi:hypothetical protein
LIHQQDDDDEDKTAMVSSQEEESYFFFMYDEMTTTANNIVVASRQIPQQQLVPVPLMKSILNIRGGSEESDDDEDDDDESDDEEAESSANGSSIDYAAVLEQVTDVTKTKVVPAVMTASKKTYTLMKNITISTYHAIQRAIQAGLEGDDDDEEEVKEDDEDADITMFDQILKVATKAAKTIKRMVEAALDFPEVEEGDDADAAEENDDDDEEDVSSPEVEVDVIVEETTETTKTKSKKEAAKDDSEDETKNEEEKEESAEAESESTSEEKDQAGATEISSSAQDFGSFLAEAYEVGDQRTAKHSVTFLGGTFRDALETASQQARMLIVYIPGERPNGGRGLFGGKTDEDALAKDKLLIENLLSTKVSKTANKKPRKNGEETGSFIIWGTKSGSSEASNVMKRLKMTQTGKGGKRPILCAVYPANLVSVSDVSLLMHKHDSHFPSFLT